MINFYADIRKCSKCGLCLKVCEMYKETGNECASARGILTMLEGVQDGKIKPDDSELLKYLKKCDLCGECSKACPSEIKIEKIVKNFLQTEKKGN